MKRQPGPPYVDQNALRSNQAFIIGLLLLGFVADVWPLVSFVALVMLAGTIIPAFSLFKQVYGRVLLPLGILRPRLVSEDPQPHRFAQGLGGVVLATATIAFLANAPIAGWGLVWLVLALAGLNLFLGFCAGCFFYYQLNRLGVPGFAQKRAGADG